MKKVKEKQEPISEFVEKYGLEWKVNCGGLLSEIAKYSRDRQGLMMPVTILGRILHEVGQRAAELNDPIMNGLMCRLAIYGESDPRTKDFNQQILDDTMKKYQEAKLKRDEKI